MPQTLHDLKVSEVSLVTAPANAEEDPRTGRKIRRATVAIWKRDSAPDPERWQRLQARVEDISHRIATYKAECRGEREQNEAILKRTLAPATAKKKPKFKDDPGTQGVDGGQREKKMSKFQKVLKTATTRDAVVVAVEKRAEKIAKRDGIGEDLALAKAWTEHPEAQEAYEAAPKETAKRVERKMMNATPAEAELDRRARKRMAKDRSVTYAKALTAELDEDPGLYTRYANEAAAGTTYLVPEPSTSQSDHPMRKAAATDDECPECGEETDDGDKYCAACGADLSKAKAKGKRSA